MNQNTITELLQAPLKFFILKYPTRTSLGASGGIFMGVLLDIFKPVIKVIDLSAISDFRLAASGIFIANLLGLFKKDKLPEAFEEQFRLIARAVKTGKLSEAQAKIYYAQIVSMAFDRARLSIDPQQKIDELTKNLETMGRRRQTPKPAPTPTPS
jgi:hypothetical protein